MNAALFAILLMAFNASALAHRVFYDFSGVQDDEASSPYVGSLYFDADEPFIPREDDGWVTHARGGVVTITAEGTHWRTTAGVNPRCSINFHVGWSLVRAWCQVSREDLPAVSAGLVLEFFEPEGRITYHDYALIGPYDEDTLRHYTVSSGFFMMAREEPFFVRRGGGTLDSIRVVPEPGIGSLLVLVGVLALALRIRLSDFSSVEVFGA